MSSGPRQPAFATNHATRPERARRESERARQSQNELHRQRGTNGARSHPSKDDPAASETVPQFHPDEVCENYMDAKFGGEEADMAEAQRS